MYIQDPRDRNKTPKKKRVCTCILIIKYWRESFSPKTKKEKMSIISWGKYLYYTRGCVCFLKQENVLKAKKHHRHQSKFTGTFNFGDLGIESCAFVALWTKYNKDVCLWPPVHQQQLSFCISLQKTAARVPLDSEESLHRDLMTVITLIKLHH